MLENFERKSHIELGNLYFWTATINGWKHLLKNDDFKQIILESLKFLSYKEKIDTCPDIMRYSYPTLKALFTAFFSTAPTTRIAVSLKKMDLFFVYSATPSSQTMA